MPLTGDKEENSLHTPPSSRLNIEKKKKMMRIKTKQKENLNEALFHGDFFFPQTWQETFARPDASPHQSTSGRSDLQKEEEENNLVVEISISG